AGTRKDADKVSDQCAFQICEKPDFADFVPAWQEILAADWCQISGVGVNCQWIAALLRLIQYLAYGKGADDQWHHVDALDQRFRAKVKSCNRLHDINADRGDHNA